MSANLSPTLSKQELHDIFVYMRENVKNSEFCFLGICFHSHRYAQQMWPHRSFTDVGVMRQVLKIAGKWPKKSRQYCYPVPRPRHYDHMNIWTGSYGAARYELLDWMINKTDANFKPEPKPSLFARIGNMFKRRS